MLAAFNVTALQDFGYPETTRFIDPMESRYRAVGFTDGDFAGSGPTFGSGPFSKDEIESKVNWFISLNAYKDVEGVEAALKSYWATHTPGATGAPPKAASSSVAVKASSTSAAVKTTPVAVTTPAPTTLVTTASGNKNQNQNQNGKKTTTA